MADDEAMMMADRKPGAIQQQVETVGDAIQQLIGAINRLEDRLKPGLFPNRSEKAILGTDEQDIDARSPLTQHLSEYAAQIIGLRRRLDELTERVEL